MSPSLLLALVLTRSCQDANPVVTYKTVAVPLSRALEDLSKSTGAKLQATAAVKDDTVLVNVKDVPWDQLKAKLAQAVVGEWTKSADGTEYLGANNAERTRRDREEKAANVAKITKSLTELRDSLKPKAGDKSVERPSSMFGMRGGDSTSTLAIQLCAGVNATDLAFMAAGDRIVYSTTPNSMQRPLRVAGIDSFVSQFVIAHNKEVAEFNTRKTETVVETNPQEEAARKLFGAVMPEPKAIESAPKKILLVAERGGMFGVMDDSWMLKLIVFDQAGAVLASTQLPIASSFMDGAMAVAAADGEDEALAPVIADTPKQTEAKPHDPKLDVKIELSERSKKYAKLTSMMGGQGDADPPKDLLEDLRHPDTIDPLSYVVSDSFFSLAQAESKNIVASIPDDIVQFRNGVFGQEGQTVNQFLESLQDNDSLKLSNDSGWRIIEPAHPISSAMMHVNRPALAKFLAAASATTIPSLNALSEYASVNPPITSTPLITMSVMLLAPNSGSVGFTGMQDWKMLRLYGNLTVSDRDALKNGRTLPFSGLTAKAKAVAHQMVYGSNARFQVGPEKETGLPSFMSAAITMGGMGSKLESYKEEATELLPSGLPAQGGLSLNFKLGHFVMTSGTSAISRFLGAMGPEEYAMVKIFSEDASMVAMGAAMPKMDTFTVGERDTLDFVLHLAPDVTQKHKLLDHRMPKDAALVSKDALPADFMASVEKQMKMLKEGFMPLLGGAGMFGRDVVPPRS